MVFIGLRLKFGTFVPNFSRRLCRATSDRAPLGDVQAAIRTSVLIPPSHVCGSRCSGEQKQRGRCGSPKRGARAPGGSRTPAASRRPRRRRVGSRRKTTAPARASCPCIDTSRVAINPPRVSHLCTATTRTNARYPAPAAGNHDGHAEGTTTRVPDRGSPKQRPDRLVDLNPESGFGFGRDQEFRCQSLFDTPAHDQTQTVVSSEGTKKRRRFEEAEKAKLCLRNVSPKPKPPRQNSLDSYASQSMHFGSLLDLLEGAPESLVDDRVSRCQTNECNASEMVVDDDDSSTSLFTDEGDSVTDSGLCDHRFGGLNSVDDSLGDAVDALFAPTETRCVDRAWDGQALRITPPTPDRRLRCCGPELDSRKKQPGVQGVREGRVPQGTVQDAGSLPRDGSGSVLQDVPAFKGIQNITTLRGRRIENPQFSSLVFVPRERCDLWTGNTGKLPSAREVMHVLGLMETRQGKVGLPEF